MKEPDTNTLLKRLELHESLEQLRKRQKYPGVDLWSVLSLAGFSIMTSLWVYRSKEPEPFEYISCAVFISLTLHQLALLIRGNEELKALILLLELEIARAKTDSGSPRSSESIN